MKANYCEAGDHAGKAHVCELCGITYCKAHAARPADEGGWDCPVEGCSGYPCAAN